jgi:Domain of unknown function (DUF4279)
VRALERGGSPAEKVGRGSAGPGSKERVATPNRATCSRDSAPVLRVNLAVFSDTLDPDELTRRLGMSCDTRSVKGESFPPPGEHRRFQRHRWRIDSEDPDDAESGLRLSEVIDALLGRIADRYREFLDLTRAGCEIELQIWFTSTTVPCLHLAPPTLRTIVALGASVDIDVVLTADGPAAPSGP